MPSEQEWDKWLNNIKIEASNLGISKETINKTLDKVEPQKK